MIYLSCVHMDSSVTDHTSSAYTCTTTCLMEGPFCEDFSCDLSLESLITYVCVLDTDLIKDISVNADYLRVI